MGWADFHIEKLRKGETVKFRPKGNSMTGRINSGQLCTVEPLKGNPVKVGEIVLCKVRGNQYLHLVSAIKANQVLISNNHGFANGWISESQIFGRCILVEK